MQRLQTFVKIFVTFLVV